MIFEFANLHQGCKIKPCVLSAESMSSVYGNFISKKNNYVNDNFDLVRLNQVCRLKYLLSELLQAEALDFVYALNLFRWYWRNLY